MEDKFDPSFVCGVLFGVTWSGLERSGGETADAGTEGWGTLVAFGRRWLSSIDAVRRRIGDVGSEKVNFFFEKWTRFAYHYILRSLIYYAELFTIT